MALLRIRHSKYHQSSSLSFTNSPLSAYPPESAAVSVGGQVDLWAARPEDPAGHWTKVGTEDQR